MIATLEGIIAESGPLAVILEVGGVGYDVQVPLTTAEKLPQAGQKVKLFIHSVYREDSAALYGFHAREDREFFKLLLEKVSGIGPRIALNILSRMSVTVLRQAIMDGNTTLISKCPGIGKKTAERLIIELKDKVIALGGTSSESATMQTSPFPGSSVAQDAVSAMVALGYKLNEAEKAVQRALKGAESPGAFTTESLVKQALQ